MNDDDVDVAIATMLESFINSQKHAVKMALRKTFRSYIVRPEDNFGLILYQLTELVRQLAPFKEVFVTQAGCTVSSHCGPGTLGVLFLRQPAR